MTNNPTNVVGVAGNDNARDKKGGLRIAIAIFLLVGLFAAFKLPVDENRPSCKPIALRSWRCC